MSIYLGNLSIDDIEKRMGINLTKDEKSELNEMRQLNAEHIAKGK